MEVKMKRKLSLVSLILLCAFLNMVVFTSFAREDGWTEGDDDSGGGGINPTSISVRCTGELSWEETITVWIDIVLGLGWTRMVTHRSYCLGGTGTCTGVNCYGQDGDCTSGAYCYCTNNNGYLVSQSAIYCYWSPWT